MSPFHSDKREFRFETAVGYLLITGVVASLLIEIIGIIAFYVSYGNLEVSESKRMFIHGQNLFNFLYELIRGEYTQQKAVLLMTLGITILILTPYVRVIFSVLYFIWKKDIQYVWITIFVLIVLTLSLAAH